MTTMPALLAPPARAHLRRRSGSTVAAFIRHWVLAFLRTPGATFFTVAFPVSFLLVIGAVMGDQVVEEGVPLSQFLVTPFLVFGVAEAAFCVLAIGAASMREDGIFLRLRGTPVPQWTVLTGRIGATAVVSLASAVLVVVIGVAVFDVRVLWEKMPAALLTLLLGVACCAALGLAVVALTRTVLLAEAITNGVLVPLAFISNVFMVGVTLPAALHWLGTALPLRHFADAMSATFNPLRGGAAFSWGDLAVMAGWTVAGTAIAVWRFGWEPRSGATSAPASAAEAEPSPPRTALGEVRTRRRPTHGALLRTQLAADLIETRREWSSLFFAVVFPALLLVLLPAVVPAQSLRGMSFADTALAGMMAYGIAIAGMVNLPEQLARTRSVGSLQRMRATPMPPWVYLGGRFTATLFVALATAAVQVAVAMAANGFRPAPARLPAMLLAVVASGLCYATIGLALVAVMTSARTTIAVTLGTLVPLSFFSDVFYIGAELPGYLQRVGDVFPLKHSVRLFEAAVRTDVPSILWSHLGVLTLWTVAAALVAARRPWLERE